MLNRYLWVAISRDICPKVSERVDIFEFTVVYMDFGEGCLVDLCLHAIDNTIISLDVLLVHVWLCRSIAKFTSEFELLVLLNVLNISLCCIWHLRLFHMLCLRFWNLDQADLTRVIMARSHPPLARIMSPR